MSAVKREGKGLEKLAVALKDLNKKVGKVGWFAGSKYPEPPNLPVAYVATIQEYGWASKNIPPRPFMRPTIAAKQGVWKSIAESESRKIIRGESTVTQALDLIGQKAAGNIRETIAALTNPPLSPITIQRRVDRKTRKTIGSLDKPLIDTGLMYGTLTNTVEDE